MGGTLETAFAAVGHTVKKLAEGKVVGLPMKRESPSLEVGDCQGTGSDTPRSRLPIFKSGEDS